MVCAHVVLALIICKILLSQAPVKCVHLLRTLVTNPEKMHFHQPGLLPLHRAVHNAYCYGIVTMHWGFWLHMPHIFEDATKNDTCLAIVEQSP